MNRLLLSLVLGGVVCSVMPAQAHFPEPSPPGWNNWAENQWNYGGFRCCNRTDVYLFEGRWERNPDGGVTIWFEDGESRILGRDKMIDR